MPCQTCIQPKQGFVVNNEALETILGMEQRDAWGRISLCF